MSDDHRILYLCRREVEAICKELDLVAIVAEALAAHAAGDVVLPAEAYLSWTNARGETARSLNMPGSLGPPLNVAGTKVINANPANPARRIARASGLTLLFDPLTARINCVLEAAFVSAMRTASVTALAADLLGNGQIEILGILGAGALANAHLKLLPRRLNNLQRTKIFDLQPERALELAQEIAPELAGRRISLDVVSSAELAVRDADLVVALTTTTEAYIRYQWLAPGTVAVNISLDDFEPEVILRADRLIVDDWELIAADDKRLLGRMYRQGLVVGPRATGDSEMARRVDAELGEVIRHPERGRLSADDIILVNPFGLSIEDISVAAHAFEWASARGVGTYLEV